MKRNTALICILVCVSLLLCGCNKPKDRLTAPAGFSVASSDVLDYYFFYPSTVWLLSESGGYLGVVKAAYNADQSSFTVNSWTENALISAKDFWEGLETEKSSSDVSENEEEYGGYEKVLSETVSDYKVVNAEVVTVAEHDAYDVVYTCTIAGMQFKIRQVTVAVKTGVKTDIYELTYTSTPEFYDDNIDAVNEMIGYFGISK